MNDHSKPSEREIIQTQSAEIGKLREEITKLHKQLVYYRELREWPLDAPAKSEGA